MKTSGHTILVTGGSRGIGFSLAKAFMEAGNTVLTCSRSEEHLAEAREQLPGLITRVCDVSDKKQREALFDWVRKEHPECDVLVNNAGIQRIIDLKNRFSDEEIQPNLVAPMHLSSLFIPLFSKKEEAAIMNVSSGLGFVPLSIAPVYCATKAAIHSFTVSLRRQLRDSSIEVFEIIPPIVDTDLGDGSREERGMTYRGIPPEEVAKAVMVAWEKDGFEIIVGQAAGLRNTTPETFDATFTRMNG